MLELKFIGNKEDKEFICAYKFSTILSSFLMGEVHMNKFFAFYSSVQDDFFKYEGPLKDTLTKDSVYIDKVIRQINLIMNSDLHLYKPYSQRTKSPYNLMKYNKSVLERVNFEELFDELTQNIQDQFELNYILQKLKEKIDDRY
jgi:hypothetical protein